MNASTINIGITIRDYFAANAPNEIPEWFTYHTGEPRPEAPLGHSDEEYEAAKSWDRRYASDRYFAWRWFYADKMLRERVES